MVTVLCKCVCFVSTEVISKELILFGIPCSQYKHVYVECVHLGTHWSQLLGSLWLEVTGVRSEMNR